MVTDDMPMTKNSDVNVIDPILPLMACPKCRAELARKGTGLACRSCASEYEIQKGIPLLAQVGSSEQWGVAPEGSTSVGYQQQFQKENIGQRYRERYQQKWYKRRVTDREIKRLGQLLASQERCHRMLDLPCGGGRVSGPLAEATDCLLQADIGISQIRMAQQVMGSAGNVVWLAASAFAIPLKDGAVDGTVCNRLTHHLPPAEQERVIGELLRVSTRFVILSYYDHNSFKSLGRRLRGNPPGHTLARGDLRTLVARHGAEVRMDLPLWYAGSRIRYALIRKRST
jgi:SAM-dependent methyltransferase